jgi:2-polyprenyl-3-methyl-5-hydroxy-6-metoxy-1,4-benzoquinol methylase
MYDQFASEYDRFVNWQNRLSLEIPLLKKLLPKPSLKKAGPIKILDAACGTGMHVLALANAGFEMVGADFSHEMIARARQNARDAGLQIQFEPIGFGSLSTFFGKAIFDAILCLGNSLPHLLKKDEIYAALADFHACLRPGGLLIIQNRNFDDVMRQRDRWMEPQTYQEGESQWIFQRFYDFNPDGTIQFNVVNLKKDADGPWQPTVLSTLLSPMLQADLTAALTKSGFKELQSFGSLGGETFHPQNSGNLVITAQKDK